MRDVSAAINTALILMGIFGVCFAFIGFVAAPFLLRDLLNTPGQVLPYSILYFRIYSIGLVFPVHL